MKQEISSKLVAISVAIFITVILSGFYIHSKLPSKQLEGEVTSLTGTLSEIGDYRTQLMAIPDADQLSNSWKKLLDLAYYYDVEVVPIAKSESGGRELFSGPLMSWSAELKGDVWDVLTLLKFAESEVPLYEYSFSIESHKMKVDVSVVGI